MPWPGNQLHGTAVSVPRAHRMTPVPAPAPKRDQAQHAPLVVILGPTASGKTALAIHVARALDGEIISADSRQIYRYMDIGTAKPTAAERAAAPHHLIDVITPDRTFTLAESLYITLTLLPWTFGISASPVSILIRSMSFSQADARTRKARNIIMPCMYRDRISAKIVNMQRDRPI